VDGIGPQLHSVDDHADQLRQQLYKIITVARQ
jgi:hypothetical protein